MSTSLGPGFHASAGKPVDSLAYERWVGRWSRMFVPMVIELGRRLPAQRPVLNLSFALADQSRLHALFASAGFRDIGVERVERHDAVEGFDAYWEPIESGVGSIPQMYLTLPEADRRAVREEVKRRLSRFEVAGKLVLSVEMLIGRGQA